MPHAWAMDERYDKEDNIKIKTLITKYNKAFNVPVIFANAVGKVEKMAGITGKLMNPKKYKLRGKSQVAVDGKIIKLNKNEKILTFECDIISNKRTNNITFYGQWIDKGSWLFRSVVIPLDVKKGIKMYNDAKRKI